MPIYDFECLSCNKVFEDIVSIKNPVPDNCPNCNNVDTTQFKKLLSAPSLGLVALYGDEVRADIQKGAAGLRRRAAKDQNFEASIFGESRYSKMDNER